MKSCKQICAATLILVFLLALLPASAFAEEESNFYQEISYCEDGGYIVTALTAEPVLSRSTSSKAGTKTVTKYNILDVKQYTFTVKGIFSYDGTTATATYVTTSYEIFQNGWECTNRSASRNGNSVTGSATFKNGLAVNYPSATITCSPSGVLS